MTRKLVSQALTISLIGLFIFPQVALGAWWNPLSWKVFHAPAKQVETRIEDSPKAVTSSQPKPVVAPVATPEKQKLYEVVRVVDGDTISINLEGKTETIRLIGINTPETVDPRKTVECFGLEASNKAKELLANKRVQIETDASQGARDKYSRLLAYVYREDGLFFNKHMIEAGYAYEYTYNLPYKYQNEFKIAQRSAQVNQKGLWAPGVCEVKSVTPASPAPQYSYPTPAASQAVQPVKSAPSVSGYSCSANTYNCPDFSTHAEAQSIYEMCGGVSNDIHRLDQDKDGEACESLP